MPTVTFELESAVWADQVKEMAAFLEEEPAKFLPGELQRLVEHIIVLTPPAIPEQGKIVVRKNIGQLVQPFNVSDWRNPRVEAVVRQKDFRAFEAIMRHAKSSALQGATAMPASAVPALHDRYRNARGRVAKGVRFKNFVLGSDVRELRDYISRKVANVGDAVRSWLPALYAVGGTLTKPGFTAEGHEFGGVESHLDDPVAPYMVAINSSRWAAGDRQEGQRIVDNALKGRTVAMQNRMKKMLADIKKKMKSA